MKIIILIVISAISIITTLALCKVAGKADKTLEYPGRITLKGDK